MESIKEELGEEERGEEEEKTQEMEHKRKGANESQPPLDIDENASYDSSTPRTDNDCGNLFDSESATEIDTETEEMSEEEQIFDISQN